MSEFFSLIGSYGEVKGDVVVLTGGANGIGAAMTKFFFDLGAKVVFGDINQSAGEEYAASFKSDDVKFVKTDITKYEDNVALFKAAMDTFGRVDHAFGIAGIIEVGNMFPPNITLEDVEKPHNWLCLRLDLECQVYFSRVATAYLYHGAQPGDNKTLTLMSSSAGLVEYSGIPAYSAAKHGIIGLVRALKESHLANYGIRVNAIAPCPTETSMINRYRDVWQKIGMPICTTDDIARIFHAVTAGKTAEGKGLNGCSIFASGDQAVEVEMGLEKTKPQWLGDFMIDSLAKAKQSVGHFTFDD